MTEQQVRERTGQDSLKFIDEAIETETIYILIADDNCLQTDSTEYVNEKEEPLVAVPVWSKSFVESAKEWAGEEATAQEMALDYFINDFVPQLEEAHCTIGINWDAQGIGREFTPFDLTDMLVKKINGEEVLLPENGADDLEA